MLLKMQMRFKSTETAENTVSIISVFT